MTDERKKEIVALLVEHAPPLIDAYFHPRSRFPSLCVFSTRVGIDTLAYFGVAAKPVAVEASAFNREMKALLERPEPPTKEEALASGGWLVQIDTEPGGKGGYPGHLVIGIEDDDTLIDLDLGQFARPAKNIVVPRAGVFTMTPEFWEGGAVAYQFERDTVLAYQRLVPPPPWTQGGDWKRKNKVTGQVIRAVRRNL